ncbi:MAG: D-tyrosyl-tRNA(Tyr) deacylase [Bacteroidales bacterium]|nr:D-tyrosyl-tRNA(Tyr) deacylase [Bacteroidales bacterium]
MRVVLQRVKEASVSVVGKTIGVIDGGMLVLVGIEDSDTNDDIEYLCRKILNLRIFDDSQGVMNLSVTDVKGALLVVSQFTLMASTRKGNRPSYIRASSPEHALPLYQAFVERLRSLANINIATGQFGANMQVSLVNDGPVTLIIDSHER